MNQSVQLTQLVESALNSRKSFDEAKLDELAASIEQHGVLQNLVVRQKGPKFEVICGTRRLRAAHLARKRLQEQGLPSTVVEELPVLVRELTDRDALELNLIENLQREGVPALEEAEGFAALRELGVTAEEIAKKISSSRSYVFARLKLTTLEDSAKELLRSGKLPVSLALLVARIPDPSVQEKAAKAMFDFDDHPISYRRAVEAIHRDYMTELKTAPFDTADETLVPAAGSCTGCPNRTGNQAELFADLAKSPHLCLLPSCFQTKTAVAWKARTKLARKAGQKVLTAKEADEVFPHGWLSWSWADLDGDCTNDSKRRTWREVLGEHCPTGVLAWNKKEKRGYEIVKRKSADKAARKAGLKWAQPAAKAEPSEEQAKWAAEERERQERKQVLQEEAESLVQRVVISIEEGKADLSALCDLVLEDALEGAAYGVAKQVCSRRGWEVPDTENAAGFLQEQIRSRPASARLALAIELLCRPLVDSKWVEEPCPNCDREKPDEDCELCFGEGLADPEPRIEIAPTVLLAAKACGIPEATP